MRLLIIFLLFFNLSFAQDSLRNVYVQVNISDSTSLIKKIFLKNDKVETTIIYFYKDGVLVRRTWYDESGNEIGTVFD